MIRNLQTLAELSKRISPETQLLASGVPWKQVVGFRNLIVHEYLHIDLQFVWQVVSVDLPVLKHQVVQLRELIAKR